MRVEPSIIIKTLKANNGAIIKTARNLGISPGTVINWRISGTIFIERNRI